MLLGEEPAEIMPGLITWGAAGKPGGGAGGEFPIELRWNNLPKEAGSFSQMSSEEFLLTIYLEVREAENPGEILTTVSARLPSAPHKTD